MPSDEVGAALTGDKFGDFRRSPNVEDRRGESWWSANGPPITAMHGIQGILNVLFPPDEPVTPLGTDAGIHSIRAEPLLSYEGYIPQKIPMRE